MTAPTLVATQMLHVRAGCRRWVQFVFACMVLFAPWPAQSFKVVRIFYLGVPLPGLPIHEGITRQALEELEAVGNGRKFDEQGITEVQAANYRTDTEFVDDPVVHFDSEKTVEAATRLRDLATAVHFQAVVRSDYPKARELLGQALHTVQDFYAHTNYANRYPDYQAPRRLPAVWDPTSTELAVSALPTCGESGLLQIGRLTSGYFVIPQSIPTLDYGWTTDAWKAAGESGTLLSASRVVPAIADLVFLWLPELRKFPDGKCVHGGDTNRGLNKDSPDRGDVFYAARYYAMRASKEYVQYVLAKFQGNDPELCRLLQPRTALTECSPGTLTRWVAPVANASTKVAFGSSISMMVSVSAMTADAASLSEGGQKNVEFRSGDRVLCRAAVSANIASCHYSPTQIGRFDVYAVYTGTNKFRASSSTKTEFEVFSSDFRFAFADLRTSQLQCGWAYARDGASPIAWSSLLADYEYCLRRIAPAASCSGAGCASGRFHVATKHYVTRTTLTQIPFPGSQGSCTDTAEVLEPPKTYGLPTTFPGPNWTSVGTTLSSFYPDGSPYWTDIQAFSFGYTRNISNVLFQPQYPGPYPAACVRTAIAFDFTVWVYDKFLNQYYTQSFTMGLP